MQKLRVKFFDKSVYQEGLLKIGGKKSDWIDLRAREDIVLEKGAFKLIPLGVAIQLPEGYEAQIRPRSGLAAKYGITVTNCVGTIDSDYIGEIGVSLINLSNETFVVHPGERIAQMVVAKYEKVTWNEVTTLDETERGSGGFGSTGLK